MKCSNSAHGTCPFPTISTTGGLKSFADGSIQSLTAVLGEPYACKPDFCGDHVLTPEQIAELIAKYHCQGVPVAFHANGDAAIEFVVWGFEEALRSARGKSPET